MGNLSKKKMIRFDDKFQYDLIQFDETVHCLLAFA